MAYWALEDPLHPSLISSLQLSVPVASGRTFHACLAHVFSTRATGESPTWPQSLASLLCALSKWNDVPFFARKPFQLSRQLPLSCLQHRDPTAIQTLPQVSLLGTLSVCCVRQSLSGMQVHTFIYSACSCFCATRTELGGCNTDRMDHKTKSIYYLDLCRKNFPTHFLFSYPLISQSCTVCN